MTVSAPPTAQTQRLIGLDLLKLFLALLVVTIHANPFRGVNDEAMWALGNGLARIAVPAFFVVAGYTFRPEVPGRSLKLVLRYLKLHFLWLALYVPAWWATVADHGWIEYAKFWVFGYWHLWFLVGLAIAVALSQLVWRLPNRALLALALAVLLAGFILQWMIGFYILPRGFWPDAKNGVLMGFPFYLIGYLTRRMGFVDRISLRAAFWGSLIGLVSVVGESELMKALGGEHPLAPETLLSAAVAGPFLVALGVKARGFPGWLTRLPIGTLSAGIYFIHVGIVIWLNHFTLPRVEVYLIAVTGATLITLGLIRTGLDRRLF